MSQTEQGYLFAPDELLAVTINPNHTLSIEKQLEILTQTGVDLLTLLILRKVEGLPNDQIAKATKEVLDNVIKLTQLQFIKEITRRKGFTQ